MRLSFGETFGPYRIHSLIGRGGMGEVYRALDTKLEREVAIKVLPVALAGDPGRLARFEREARVLAQLNHPGIASIHGVEDGGALIMELVSGPTLAGRIAQGPIPPVEAEEILLQLARALEYAHEKGIVHRDLKPANIKLDSEDKVKILDFGLAKALAGPVSAEADDPTNSPTITMGGTMAGTILGTAAYMAPEQARGKKVDKRADVWAFGAIVWEMLAGERLFQGEDTFQVLSRVLEQKIDLDRLPERFRTLLARCLDRNPKDRLRDIGDARFLLGAAAAPEKRAESIPTKGPAGARIAWTVSALLAVALSALSWAYLRTDPPAAEPVRFEILPPEKHTLSGAPAMSPDGHKIAFVANDINNRPALWVRTLDSLEVKQVTENTEGIVSSPFWSPDSRYLGYKAGTRLKRVEASGASQDLCDVGTAIFEGASWGRKGWIVYALASLPPGRPGVWKVSAAGGAPLQVTSSLQAQEVRFGFAPTFLPDGEHFLYAVRSSNGSIGTYIGAITAAPDKQSTRQLLSTTSQATFAPLRPGGNRGHILFLRDTTLYAQPFDASKLELTADPVPVASSVGSGIRGQVETGDLTGSFSVSEHDALVFRPGSNEQQQLTWLDRQGKPHGSIGDPGSYSEIDLSPDGKRLAAVRNGDIWIIDLDRNVSTRFTLDGADNHSPVRSRDGSRLAFESDRDGAGAIFVKLAGGASQDLLYQGDLSANPTDWAPSNHSLILTATRKTGTDVLLLPLASGFRPDPPVRALAETQFNEGQGKVSPDGRWIVYASLESGRNQAYVRPFPSGDGKWVVSRGTGVEYRWRGDSRELYYRSGSRMMAVEVKPGSTFQPAEPRLLFEAPVVGAGAFNRNPNYTVTADGQKFLAVVAGTDSRSDAITVMLNWQGGLKK